MSNEQFGFSGCRLGPDRRCVAVLFARRAILGRPHHGRWRDLLAHVALPCWIVVNQREESGNTRCAQTMRRSLCRLMVQWTEHGRQESLTRPSGLVLVLSVALCQLQLGFRHTNPGFRLPSIEGVSGRKPRILACRSRSVSLGLQRVSRRRSTDVLRLNLFSSQSSDESAYQFEEPWNVFLELDQWDLRKRLA